MKLQKNMELEALPDEIWTKVLEIGVQNFTLGCKDLCSLSISCKFFNNLSTQDNLWSTFLTRHFPSSSSTSSSSSRKSSYVQLVLARNRRIVLNREHRLARFARKIKRIQRELRFVNEQLRENSGELLAMVQDRYVVCRRNLAKAIKKHMRIEKEVCATLVDKDYVLEDDLIEKVASDDSSEESWEDETEQVLDDFDDHKGS